MIHRMQESLALVGTCFLLLDSAQPGSVCQGELNFLWGKVCEDIEKGAIKW